MTLRSTCSRSGLPTVAGSHSHQPGRAIPHVRETYRRHHERAPAGRDGPRRSSTDWSSDGRFLLYTRGNDIWALDPGGDRKAFPVVETMFKEMNGQFSPDSRWIAYQSDESGRAKFTFNRFQVQRRRRGSPATAVSRCAGVTTARSSLTLLSTAGSPSRRSGSIREASNRACRCRCFRREFPQGMEMGGATWCRRTANDFWCLHPRTLRFPSPSS